MALQNNDLIEFFKSTLKPYGFVYSKNNLFKKEISNEFFQIIWFEFNKVISYDDLLVYNLNSSIHSVISDKIINTSFKISNAKHSAIIDLSYVKELNQFEANLGCINFNTLKDKIDGYLKELKKFENHDSIIDHLYSSYSYLLKKVAALIDIKQKPKDKKAIDIFIENYNLTNEYWKKKVNLFLKSEQLEFLNKYL